MKNAGIIFLLVVISILTLNSCKKDTTPPVITIIGDNPLTVALGQPFVDPGATAYDETDGDITNKINTTVNVDTNVEGFDYHVLYDVEDDAGNKAHADRTVHVLQF
jgi:hypothetical protein